MFTLPPLTRDFFAAAPLQHLEFRGQPPCPQPLNPSTTQALYAFLLSPSLSNNQRPYGKHIPIRFIGFLRLLFKERAVAWLRGVPGGRFEGQNNIVCPQSIREPLFLLVQSLGARGPLKQPWLIGKEKHKHITRFKANTLHAAYPFLPHLCTCSLGIGPFFLYTRHLITSPELITLHRDIQQSCRIGGQTKTHYIRLNHTRT